MKRCIILILTGFFLVCCSSVIEAKTFYVTAFNDTFGYDGVCSLREAIVAANGATLIDAACGLGDPGKDVIMLEPGEYYLMTPDNGDDGLWGDLDITSEIVLTVLPQWELRMYKSGRNPVIPAPFRGQKNASMLDRSTYLRCYVMEFTVEAVPGRAGSWEPA